MVQRSATSAGPVVAATAACGRRWVGADGAACIGIQTRSGDVQTRSRAPPQGGEGGRCRLPCQYRTHQRPIAKAGPQAGLPVQQCMAALPAQEVGQTLLPARSNEQVDGWAVAPSVEQRV